MNSTLLTAQDNTPKAAENIHRVLKCEILRGEIESGALLSESKLAKRFGVSRTPSREALSKLANDRLTFSLPQRGHLVRTISFSEAMEAFQLRELLEVEAVRLAVHRIPNEKINYLKNLIDNPKNDEIGVFNYEIHTTIAKASENRILAEFIEELLILMERILLVDPEFRQNTSESVQPEAEIIAALENRDETAACEAMRRHIRNTMSRVLKVK
jgi:DNA-binding GntR family transcriptional regulator